MRGYQVLLVLVASNLAFGDHHEGNGTESNQTEEEHEHEHRYHNVTELNVTMTEVATNVTSNVPEIAMNVTDVASNVTWVALNATNVAMNGTDVAMNGTEIAMNGTTSAKECRALAQTNMDERCPIVGEIGCVDPPTKPKLCKDDCGCPGDLICCTDICEGSRCIKAQN